MDRETTPVADGFASGVPQSKHGNGLLAALRETTFRSLRHRNYRLYFFGQIVSFTGSWMQSTALMWLMFHETHDPRWPSWLLVAQVGPTLLLGTWGGHLADRVHKPRLVFATQFGFLVNAVILTLLVGGNFAEAWLILGLQALSGVIQAVDLPTRLALVPDLVSRQDLVNAVGLNSLLFNSARAVGPAMAAAIFAGVEFAEPLLPAGTDRVRLGATLCFGLNSLSFIAVLAALRAIDYPAQSQANKTVADGSIWQGFRYLIAQPALGGLVLLTLVVCAFAWPVLTLMPAYTAEVLKHGEQSYNALVSGIGAGALVAALVTATFGKAEYRKIFLIVGSFATGLGLLGLTFAHGLPAAVFCTAFTGFGLILYLSTGQLTLQLGVPDDRRGRVMALWAMTLSASAPIGHLIAGQQVIAFGVIPVLRGMAFGVLLASTGLACLIAWKRLRGEGRLPV